MAPSATTEPATAARSRPVHAQDDTDAPSKIQEAERADVLNNHVLQDNRAPLKLGGSLAHFEQFDVTPVIGREFVDVDLAEWLRAPNSDVLIRDLAITVSQRGVVFFRKQDGLDNGLQKELVQRLGQLAGKPASSGLHIHPVSNASRAHAAAASGGDDEISVISSAGARALNLAAHLPYTGPQSQRGQWHSDITFEPVPSDYAALRLTELPRGSGGDTLWASGYEVYDRISPPVCAFLESLTAIYAQPGFQAAADANGFRLHEGPRGAPENVGTALKAVHPVVRTNPVTGWKSVFALGHHVQRINGLADDESRALLDWFVRLVADNHDLQARLRWRSPNDLAIWDNRSVYHAATPDYLDTDEDGDDEEGGKGRRDRTGVRVVSLGERPYLDPHSSGRREALAAARTRRKYDKASTAA